MELGGDYFSNDPEYNPMMFNWNMVYMQYCDGASFSGANLTVTEYGGKNLYFRGAYILEIFQQDLLNNHGLDMATDVVISGCSAGGLATYLHVDQWRAVIPPTARVVGMPDSGFFLDYETQMGYASGMQWVFEQQNATSGVDSDCIENYWPLGEPWMCIFAEHVSPFIQTPIFPLQPIFDSWQIPNILGSTDPTSINEYGTLLMRLVFQNLLPDQRHGVWLDSCYHHCTSGLWNLINVEGQTMATAFAEWYNNYQWYFIDEMTYPCQQCCQAGSKGSPK